MMHSVKFAATSADLQAILQLRYAVLRAPWGQPMETATDALENTSINAFIEGAHSQVIACGRLQENEHKTGQIRFMAVDTTYQGQGLGKKILAALEDQARQLRLTKIELQARENALDFYKSCGYTVKEKSFLLWGLIQHYLMEKEI